MRSKCATFQQNICFIQTEITLKVLFIKYVYSLPIGYFMTDYIFQLCFSMIIDKLAQCTQTTHHGYLLSGLNILISQFYHPNAQFYNYTIIFILSYHISQINTRAGRRGVAVGQGVVIRKGVAVGQKVVGRIVFSQIARKNKYIIIFQSTEIQYSSFRQSIN